MKKKVYLAIILIKTNLYLVACRVTNND